MSSEKSPLQQICVPAVKCKRCRTVRVHNYGEEESLGRLTLTYPGCHIKAVYKTDLDENRAGDIANVGNSVVFALRPAGLQTFEIEME